MSYSWIETSGEEIRWPIARVADVDPVLAKSQVDAQACLAGF
jgi:hypothetical protein